MHPMRTIAIALALLLLGSGSALASEADSNFVWPTKSLEVVIPASAGGDTDFNARTIAKYFRKVAGVPMVVTNMAGGGGSIATSHVKEAKPDGVKALFCHTGQLVVNEVAGLIPYSYDGFAVCCIAAINKSYLFAASKKSGITNLSELISKAKAAPGKVIYGTEFGGYTHLQGLRLEKMAEIQLKIVDTGSTAEKTTSLLAGRIDFASVPYAAVQDYRASGDVAILGQGGAKRNPLLGDLPTFSEQGLNFTMEIPYVISFPKGTDPRIVKKMAEIIKIITAMPEYAKDIEAGYKQIPEYYDTAEALKYLAGVRLDFMQYKDLLKK